MGRRMTAIEAPEWHTAAAKSPIQSPFGKDNGHIGHYFSDLLVSLSSSLISLDDGLRCSASGRDTS